MVQESIQTELFVPLVQHYEQAPPVGEGAQQGGLFHGSLRDSGRIHGQGTQEAPQCL